MPFSEIESGSPLRPHIAHSLYAPDYVGNPEEVRGAIARVEMQRKRIDGHLRNLNEELARHEACRPDGVE